MIVDEKENAMYGSGPWEKVYLFAIGHGTDPTWNEVRAKREAAGLTEALRGYAGLIGVRAVWPKTLALFDTADNAKAARDAMEAAGHECGTYIMKARMSRACDKIEIAGKAEEQGG